MYSIKVESDPTCIMSEPFYGIISEPYLLSVYKEDHTSLIEVEIANLANKYQKFASKSILPKFSYIKKNVELEENIILMYLKSLSKQNELLIGSLRIDSKECLLVILSILD